jgi:predicted Ser/Thr protein kinase/AraC-like DNA-binding protein
MIAPNPLSTEREERLHELLLDYLEAEARGQAPDTRQFLDTHAEFAQELAEFLACRQRVESIVAPLRGLSRGHKGAGEETHSLTVAAQIAPPPRLLGDFQLVREIGRGGMGIVYEAEQLSLKRRVAVKVLPFAAALDPKQLHRFQNEAKMAALLHHPNIVPVYAVGCESGVHYFAMQFIQGRSLAEMIRENVSGLDKTRIAELGLRAAQALEHAHQQGIIHRDIKPANLLIDERDELWITDFGLATFQTGPGVTLSGELVGTLRYMSPEQALAKRGLIDHRTDIYSLGATLYELLTLQPVFAGQDGQELLFQIAYQEPILPRSLDRTIAIDLETILLKALAKAPAERYASAGELADDLQRFLEHKPILARRPPLLDKAAKWARRHRALVAVGLVAFLLLIGGQMASHYFLAQEHRQLQLKTREAKEQRAQAEANFRQARRAVDFFVELSDEEMLERADVLEIRKKLLEAALTYYKDFLDQHGDDASIQTELTDSRTQAARILDQLEIMQGDNPLELLANKAVQEDLHMSQKQLARLFELDKEVLTFWGKQADEFRQGGREKRCELRRMMRQRCDRAVAEFLTPSQARRLRQLILQRLGVRAFDCPEVIEALGLTPPQQQALYQRHNRERLHREREFWKVISRGMADTTLEQFVGMVVELHRLSIQNALEALTVEQQARWKELTGEPCRPGVLFFVSGAFHYLR